MAMQFLLKLLAAAPHTCVQNVIFMLFNALFLGSWLLCQIYMHQPQPSMIFLLMPLIQKNPLLSFLKLVK
jgi:hypothetical protein